MAIPHALPGQIIDIQPLGDSLAGEKSRALFKSDDLELMHLVLRAGQSLPPHKVPGDITIQCIEGLLQVDVEGQATLLRAGQLLYLRGGALHAVTAVEAGSALVTVALKR
jgi:quercetin dioxygenase-like cupin family protein